MLPFNATEKQKYGAEVEEWVLAELAAQGYPARLMARWGDAFDLVIDAASPVRVEVKAARRRMRKVRPGYYAPEWRWHVANIADAGDYLLALVAEDWRGERWLFLVPSWEAFGRQGLSITSHPRQYTGRLAKYLAAWPMIEWAAGRGLKNQIELITESQEALCTL